MYETSLNFKDFNYDIKFIKWSSIEFLNSNEVPKDYKTYILKGGLYTVFIHKGQAGGFSKTFEFIFSDWIPNSNYERDNREHFDLIGIK
ncbi:GyrI-like domain-containing protein [Polaribacter filamentus]|uniref:GyrI-like domain-containing protein n=1 Tax=Polaribacter filamentus TaxID=53483 RepID=UPI000CF2BA47|nr:GyrI-like domain-containing protein [Polaribacter filamentus]